MPIYAQSSTLRNLTIPLVDIDFGTLEQDQILKYNETTGKFENSINESTANSGIFTIENNIYPAINHTMYLLYGETTNDTETELFLDNISLRILIPSNTTMQFEADIVGRDLTGSKHCGFKLQGVIDRTNNTTVLVNTVNETIVAETQEEWFAFFEADNANNSLTLKVIGEDNVTIRWAAFVKTTSIQY